MADPSIPNRDLNPHIIMCKMNQRKTAKCPLCDMSGYIPEDYQGDIKCPKCNSSFQRTGNPHSLVRKLILEKIKDIERVGLEKVTWFGGDEHSCDKCKERNGKNYRIQEIIEILDSPFCDSDPFEQGCRCTIGACK